MQETVIYIWSCSFFEYALPVWPPTCPENLGLIKAGGRSLATEIPRELGPYHTIIKHTISFLRFFIPNPEQNILYISRLTRFLMLQHALKILASLIKATARSCVTYHGIQ